jgi:hypothetical protein
VDFFGRLRLVPAAELPSASASCWR